VTPEIVMDLKSEQQNVEPGFAKQRLRHGKQGISNVEVTPSNRAYLRYSAVRFFMLRGLRERND
jgi:hypothetical protein